MNKKVLIIGGTGFIGKHTSLKLVDDGYKVFIMDQSRSLLHNKKGFPKKDPSKLKPYSFYVDSI